MNYLNRYLNGNHEQVWRELLALGPAVRDEPHLAQAQAVAAETMQRVRRNCERLVPTLQDVGYLFGSYPDGTPRQPTIEPVTLPSATMQVDMAELEAEAGMLPLSLVAFWQQVGSVDFVGMHPAWPDGLDPLVVELPEAALAMLYEQDEGAQGVEWFAGLAPDDFHKDNVSGGEPYGVYLPDSAADFVFRNERHKLHFVPYLRFALLERGSFPGLPETDQQMVPLQQLTADLEPF
jgi:hypothetical protein